MNTFYKPFSDRKRLFPDYKSTLKWFAKQTKTVTHSYTFRLFCDVKWCDVELLSLQV